VTTASVPSIPFTRAAIISATKRRSGRATSPTSTRRCPCGPDPGFRLNANLDFFWRYSTGDGVNAPNGILIRAAGDGANDPPRIISLSVQYRFKKNLPQAWHNLALR
jgi:hypothetical protein